MMFKRNCIRILFILILTSAAYLIGINPDSNMLSTLFTVLSILISIGLSIIISFDLSKIKNDFFHDRILNNLKEVRNTFLIYFAVITFSYIISPKFLLQYEESTIQIYDYKILLPNLVNNFIFSLMVFGIAYYMYNFYRLQSLKNEIDNELRKNNTVQK